MNNVGLKLHQYCLPFHTLAMLVFLRWNRNFLYDVRGNLTVKSWFDSIVGFAVNTFMTQGDTQLIRVDVTQE